MAKVNSLITVGLEVECVTRSQHFQTLVQQHDFSIHLDHSIRGPNGATLPRTWPDAGTEIVSRPIPVPVSVNGDGSRLVLDTAELHRKTEAIVRCMGSVNESCGIHVHLGKPSKADKGISLWEPEKVRTMLIVCRLLEDKLMGMVHPSRVNNHHCDRIATKFSASDFVQFYPVGRTDPVKYNNPKRYCWLNLIETVRKGNRTDPGHGGSPATGTVEIRLLGETDSVEYITAWVYLWTKIAAIVAYASPTTMAISHCCISDTLSEDFKAVLNACNRDREINARWRPPSPTNPATVVGSQTTYVATSTATTSTMSSPPNATMPAQTTPVQRRRRVMAPEVSIDGQFTSTRYEGIAANPNSFIGGTDANSY